MVEEFGCQEVFEVLVVCDDIDGHHGALEIVAPDSECFVNRE